LYEGYFQRIGATVHSHTKAHVVVASIGLFERLDCRISDEALVSKNVSRVSLEGFSYLSALVN
jgi:hypothetical protein